MGKKRKLTARERVEERFEGIGLGFPQDGHDILVVGHTTGPNAEEEEEIFQKILRRARTLWTRRDKIRYVTEGSDSSGCFIALVEYQGPHE